MKFHTAILTVILYLTWPQLTAQYDQDFKKKIDVIFKEIDRTDSPGCAILIVDDGEIIYKQGYGMADLERHVPIQTHSVFYAGSISKQFVAACALLLSERGLLDLQENVQAYLTDFPEYEKPVTVQHLIYHTSGIKDYFEILEAHGLNYLNQIRSDKVYDLIRKETQLDFLPGDKYSYSNSGYLMLAMIIEKVSGISFSKFVDQEIFEPLGMEHSLFLDDASKLIPNRAWGYSQNVEGEVVNMLMRFDLVGSGGLYTTVEDLFLWDQNFYETKIGSPAFLDKMLTTGRLNDGSDTKYAFAIRKDTFLGEKVIGHSGSLGGYRAQFFQMPEKKQSVIILSNSARFKPGEWAHQIAKVLLEK